MRRFGWWVLASAGLLGLIACGGASEGDTPDPGPDAAEVAAEVAEVTPDVAEVAPDAPDGDDTADAESEATGPDFPLPELTGDVPLRAGVAVRTMPLPIGIPISGNGPSNACPKGPYAKNYPANDREYTAPMWKVVALEGGRERLIFVRGDLIGIDSYTRQDVIERLKARTGHDFSDTLFFGATHTHSGPARLSKNPMFAMLQDAFFPEHTERMLESLVQTVLDALADLEPARIGLAVADGTGLHNDRRCEDPDFDNPALPVLRIDTTDGSTKAVIVVFAIHGTVIGADACTISRDVAGGIEAKLEERFDHHVPVLFYNSWAGDMSPGSASIPTGGSVVPSDFVRIEGLGNDFAERVLGVFEDVAWQEGVVPLSAHTYWIPLSREALGYADGEFPFQFGGAYCGGLVESSCWDDPGGQIPHANLDKGCIPLTEAVAAPGRTLVTAGRLGDWLLITFPGEPVTEIGQAILDGIHQLEADAAIVFLGYTQDYIGYSTPEYSWYLGGYEASGALWGPKQGDYLAARTIDAMQAFLSGGDVPWQQPEAPVVTPNTTGPLAIPDSLDLGTWPTQPAASYGPGQLVEVTFLGGDGWYGAPIITVERQGDQGFEPVTRANGTVITNESYEMDTNLILDPKWVDDREAKARRYLWTVRLATTRPAATTTAPLVGTFRFAVHGTARVDGADQAFETFSQTFSVAE